MPARQGRTRGSIEERGPGKYRVRVYAGKDAVTRKAVYLIETVDSWTAAQRKRTEFLRKVDEGKAAKTKVRFGYVLDQYLESRASELAEGTLTSYRQQIRDYLKPEFGELTLPEIDRHLVQRAEKLYADLAVCSRRCRGREFTEHHRSGQGNSVILTDLSGHRCGKRCGPHRCEGLSVASIRQIHTILNGACSAADRWGWLSPNPVTRIRQPKRRKPKPQSPTAAQMVAMVGAAFEEDVEWGTSVWLLAMTGSRRGEHVNVQVCDFDFESNLFRVKDYKTDSQRWIKLDHVTMQLIAEQIERIRHRRAELGLAVTGEEYLHSYVLDHSKPGSASYFTHRFVAMAKRLGLSATPHKLRHFSATELLAARIGLPAVAGRLGHGSGGQTTLKYYAAWLQETDDTAVRVLADRMPQLPQVRREKTGRDFSAEQSRRTDSDLEDQICGLRRAEGIGPKRIKARLAEAGVSIAESTVWLVLKRNGLSRAA